MKLSFFAFALLETFTISQARKCHRFTEFKCFWDGACIPVRLQCNGVHDCVGGEDESNLFAECNHCPGKFHCHKDKTLSRRSCISTGYLCDGFPDCLHEEDESYEFAKCPKKCRRDPEKALLVGRPDCKKTCKSDAQCKLPQKPCICDHECGMSCVNIEKSCPQLDMFPNLKDIRYVQRDPMTKKMQEAKYPFLYDVRAIHTCEAGYVSVPDSVRLCHGRENPDGSKWTRQIVCAPSCDAKDKNLIRKFKLKCGSGCTTDHDCAAGESCTCDGPCGRTCVNLNVECADVPPVKNAYIQYTGKKFDRVAHYICVEGTYKAKGDTSRKCSGDGQWDGEPIVCKDVYCGDPIANVLAMGGNIVRYSPPPYKFNVTLKFSCGAQQRLLGASTRTCLADGRWSGVDTVCDNIGKLERCPHPGIPVNGDLMGSKSDSDFLIGKHVTFRCDEGFIMAGHASQKCLFLKQWSGGGAPQCIDTRYSDSPSDVIRKLSQSASNFKPTSARRAISRVISGTPIGGHEVYFLIDLSESMDKKELTNTIAFAKSLVKRLSINGTANVRYGIIVFATVPDLKMDVHDAFENVTDSALRVLGDIEKDIANIRKVVQYGTNIDEALGFLDDRQLAFSVENDVDRIIKRHIFVLTDGIHTAGGKPTNARTRIERAYGIDTQEFYSITSAAASNDPEAHEELRRLASKDQNFIYVEDFYKLHTYVDQVTDIREDYSKCGQAGPDASVIKVIEVGRVVGGTNAVERAWPWQALITEYKDEENNNLLHVLNNVRGGGSLVSTKWVMTAAHLFDNYAQQQDGWWETVVVTLGLIHIPQKHDMLAGSARMIQPKAIFIHPDYDAVPFDNDIALIRLGGEFIVSENRKRLLFPEPNSDTDLTLSPYIRPVCLPCSPNSCVSEVLKKKDAKGKILLDGSESEEERCNIEYKFLMGKNSNGNVAVVGTGFGHLSNITHGELADEANLKTATTLQQAILQIQDRSYCQKGIKAINNDREKEFQMEFTDHMICGIGHREDGMITDTCKGDSGGPIVREVRDETTKESCFVQLGIVSWGHGCAQSTLMDHREFFYPGFYSDVQSLLPWVTKTMRKQE